MLTLIIPARDWPQERLDYCIQSFLALNSKLLTEIVVVDFGSATALSVPKSKLVKLLRLEARRWSLPEAINAGVLVARNDLIAKTDADILITPQSVEEFDETVWKVAEGYCGLAVAQAVDLPPDVTPAQASDLASANRSDVGSYRPKWGQGGLVVFSRATWDQIGGFESRFTGWGNEDNDFAERIRRIGLRLYWMDRDKLSILHTWHPPSHAATGVLSQRQRNQKIARDDRSVLRPVRFLHSNFEQLATPHILSAISPVVTLGIATTARPNRDRMIIEAINSFRGQLDNDFEVLIVDNGSPPDQTKLLEQKLAKIRWSSAIRLDSARESSIPGARNQISRAARGRYICVVDDDDLALPNRLVDHLQPFQANGSIHGTHGGWIDFDESTGVIERNQGKQRTIATLLKGTGKITAHPASLYRTDVMRAVPYDEAFSLGSDLDLAIRLANSEFEIAHTGTYLTLRRYHSANVTITGQANQVSNGALARSRALATFDWHRIAGLEEEAKANDGEVYCRNQMSIDSLAELIPGYSGAWQIYVPIAAFALQASAAAAVDIADGSTEIEVEAELSAKLASADEPSSDVLASNAGLLEQLTDFLPGELCTQRSGLNQIVCYRSDAIQGLKRARKLKAQAEELIGRPIQMNSARQGQIDREAPFDWAALKVNSGERILQSSRFGDLAELMVTLSAVDQDSLLRSTLSVLSDFDEQGEAYYIITTPIRGYDEIRHVEFELERTLRIPFRHLASNGVASELTLSARSH